MQLGVFARTFPAPDVGACLQAASAAGFAAVQFNLSCAGLPSLPERVPAPLAAEISAAAGAAKVEIVALSGTYNMAHPDPAVRADGRRQLGVVIAAAPTIGTRLVTLCTGSRDPHDQWRHHPENASPAAWRDLLREMEAAVLASEEHDVLLGVEPELANVVASAERAATLIDELGSPRVRIVIDPANLFHDASMSEQRRIVSAAAERLADRIVLAHAKDRTADGRPVAAGEGIIDFPHFLSTLRASAFDGPVVAHGFTAAEAPGSASYLARALAAVA